MNTARSTSSPCAKANIVVPAPSECAKIPWSGPLAVVRMVFAKSAIDAALPVESPCAGASNASTE
jgi:hypothetical protein